MRRFRYSTHAYHVHPYAGTRGTETSQGGGDGGRGWKSSRSGSLRARDPAHRHREPTTSGSAPPPATRRRSTRLRVLQRRPSSAGHWSTACSRSAWSSACRSRNDARHHGGQSRDDRYPVSKTGVLRRHHARQDDDQGDPAAAGRGPKAGIVTFLHQGFNQRDEEVCMTLRQGMMRRRPTPQGCRGMTAAAGGRRREAALVAVRPGRQRTQAGQGPVGRGRRADARPRGFGRSGAQGGSPRRTAAEFIAAQHATAGPRLFVRINPLDTPLAMADLAAVVVPGLAGIMLPKTTGAHDVERLGHCLDALEARAGFRPVASSSSRSRPRRPRQCCRWAATPAACRG